MNACTLLINLSPQNTDEIDLYFYVASYWLVGNNFQRITNTQLLIITINVGETFGCNRLNLINDLQPRVHKGDRSGAFIQQQ